MSQSLPQHIEEKTAGLKNLVLVVTMLLVFLMASRTPLDSDMWWHLRGGQIMLATGDPLLTDMFSFTRAGADWINHSWLGEILLFGIFNLSGWSGLSVWMGIMAVLTGWFIWMQIPGGVFSRSGFVLLASIVSAPLWTPRPQFFSLFLLAGVTWFVNRRLETGGKRIWLLLPLFVIWSNLHAGFVLGVIYLLACSVGIAMDGIGQPSNLRTENFRLAMKLAGTAAAGYVLAAINPNGVKMWFIPFNTVGVDVLRKFIQEWASPDFHQPEVWPFAFLVMLLIIVQSLSRKPARFLHLLPVVLFIMMAFFARRNIAAAAVVCTPMLAATFLDVANPTLIKKYLPENIKKFLAANQYLSTPNSSSNLTRFINLSIVVILGLVSFVKIAIISHPVVFEALEKKTMPFDAVKFVQSNPLPVGENLFNSYNWGGYLIWKVPGQKVFVDGRTDLFGDEILGEWLDIIQASDGWEDSLRKWNISRVIIEPDKPLAKVLPLKGWLTVYQDEISIILENGSR